jgi:energy-coupling factor transporter ATP-binding protein EcfA2
MLERVDVMLKSPFTTVVTGPTGSGKTRLLVRLIKSAKTVGTQPPVDITYCYGEWQSSFELVDNVTFHEGLIDVNNEIPNDNQPRWIIIDDLMNEAGGRSTTDNLFTKGSHHKNVSVFFVTQNPFKKEHRTMSLNAHYYFWFKNPRDKLSVVNFAKQAFPGTSSKVLEVYAQSTSRPWLYLLFDLRQETNDKHHLIGDYASEDRPMRIYDVKST